MRRVLGDPPPLPLKRTAAVRGGGDRETIEVSLATVTPVLGGGVKTRDVDHTDIIRVPTIRGHLRFWWRALYAHTFEEPMELYAAEKALWGGTTDERSDQTGARSQVEVMVRVTDEGNEDPENVFPYDTRDHGMTPGAYALWPARGTSQDPIAPRRERVRFDLRLTTPAGDQEQVRRTVVAWILFGGYGGRTRRGVGSLTVTVDAAAWLPTAATVAELQALLGLDLRVLAGNASDCPSLSGAQLWIGRQPQANPVHCWTAALKWLSDFRQGAGSSNQAAREPDPTGGSRPHISRWPEADKVRRLSRQANWTHPPRHNAEVVWPRAGFGLPIIGQFQKNDRSNNPTYVEPRDFELHWLLNGQDKDRLASPLIVKALPLADGRFVACALWLHRGYPAGGRPALREGDPRAVGSSAPFDALEAPNETAFFAPLRGRKTPSGHNLRDAFFGWLTTSNRAQEVS